VSDASSSVSIEGLPSPLRPLACTNPDCTLASGGSCARASEFQSPEAECPDLLRLSSGAAAPRLNEPQAGKVVVATHPQVVEARTRWGGGKLNQESAEELMRGSPARVFGVLGPANVGKTCLLTAFFLELAQGQHHDLPYRFAGSRSLLGFQALCERAATWGGSPGQEIVDRTKVGENDDASVFFHLSLRPRSRSDDRVVDVLLTDVPGEWVTDLAANDSLETRQRLAWLPRADVVMALVDAPALVEQGGQREDLRFSRVIERALEVSRESERHPAVVVVFTKVDKLREQLPTSPEALKQPETWPIFVSKARRVLAALARGREQGVNIRSFAVSAFPSTMEGGHPVNVMAPFVWAMSQADARACWEWPAPPTPAGAQGFLAVRRWSRQ
jgi:hypothetical protein